MHAGGMTTYNPAQSTDAYRGQVALIPPASSFQTGQSVSRSYGVVAVRQKKEWQYIKKRGNLNQAVADTFCREMGFTHALMNSVMNVSLSEHIYNYTYHLSFM